MEKHEPLLVTGWYRGPPRNTRCTLFSREGSPPFSLKRMIWSLAASPTIRKGSLDFAKAKRIYSEAKCYCYSYIALMFSVFIVIFKKLGDCVWGVCLTQCFWVIWMSWKKMRYLGEISTTIYIKKMSSTPHPVTSAILYINTIHIYIYT